MTGAHALVEAISSYKAESTPDVHSLQALHAAMPVPDPIDAVSSV
jgi:hypothetical protein